MPARKGPGRPPEIPDRVTLYVYLTAAERRRIAQAAHRAKLSVSAWMRIAALTTLRGGTGIWRGTFVAMLATACATTPAVPPVRRTPMPPVPNVQTTAGGQCVRECQALYNQCLDHTWYSAPVGPAGDAARASAAEAGNACRENLGGCYSTCR